MADNACFPANGNGTVLANDSGSTERAAQKNYWLQHTEKPTVEAMMLDSQAAVIDQLERPEAGLRRFGPIRCLEPAAAPLTAGRLLPCSFGSRMLTNLLAL